MTGVREGILSAGGSAALSVAAKVAFAVYDKFTGNSYSKEEIARLEELKHLYNKFFHLEAPLFWELDDKNNPTHCIKNQNWFLHIQQLEDNRNQSGNFHYQTTLIADIVSSYLKHRKQRKSGGKGKPGDLVEQFFGEWIHFALNDLSTYDFDEKAIERLGQRLQYLENVQKNESIFKFGIIKRNKNKFDTMESIKQQLHACRAFASQEILRRCARQEFDVCRRESSAVLLSCARFMYYARQSKVDHEPIELSKFISPNGQYLTEAENLLYPLLHKTHTGAMLAEVVSQAGLVAFGTVENEPVTKMYEYIDLQLQARPIQWKKERDCDMPPWVETDTEVKEQLSSFQELAKNILKTARIKQLLEEAYELAGTVGDFWAYGDKQGRASLDALLFLLETELAMLKKRVNSIYQFHDSRRQSYNIIHQINAAKGVNPNFNKVDRQKEMIDSYCQSVNQAIFRIRQQMKDFPDDMPKRIDEKKKAFYHAVNECFKQFHPDRASAYQVAVSEKPALQAVARTIEEKPLAAATQLLTPKTEKPEVTTFQLNLVESEKYKGYWYLNKDEFKDFIYRFPNQNKVETRQQQWKLGNKYYDWMKGFFTRHISEFQQYQAHAAEFSKNLSSVTEISMMQTQSITLVKHIQQLKQKIEEERPRWRFKRGVWPIKTKGWPFNREAHRFAKHLLNELGLLEGKIKQSAESRVNNPKADFFLSSNDIRALEKILDRDERKKTATAWSQANRTYQETLEEAKRDTSSITIKKSLLEPTLTDEEDKPKEYYTSSAKIAILFATSFTSSDGTQFSSKTAESCSFSSQSQRNIQQQVSRYLEPYNKLNQWQTAVETTLNEWVHGQYKKPFLWVTNLEMSERILGDILTNRDALTPELLFTAIESLNGLNDELDIYIKMKNVNSVSQGQLILLKQAIQFILLPNNEQRASRLRAWRVACQQTFNNYHGTTEQAGEYATKIAQQFKH